MIKNLYFVFFFVSIFQITFAQISFGHEQIIEQNGTSFVHIHSGDLDGDGDQDVIAGYGVLKWYENDGNGNFINTHPLSLGGGTLQSIYIIRFRWWQ